MTHPRGAMESTAELTSPSARIQLVHYHFASPPDSMLRVDGKFRIELCLTPRHKSSRACFRDHWKANRFERIGPLFLVPRRLEKHMRWLAAGQNRTGRCASTRALRTVADRVSHHAGSPNPCPGIKRRVSPLGAQPGQQRTAGEGDRAARGNTIHLPLANVSIGRCCAVLRRRGPMSKPSGLSGVANIEVEDQAQPLTYGVEALTSRACQGGGRQAVAEGLADGGPGRRDAQGG